MFVVTKELINSTNLAQNSIYSNSTEVRQCIIDNVKAQRDRVEEVHTNEFEVTLDGVSRLVNGNDQATLYKVTLINSIVKIEGDVTLVDVVFENCYATIKATKSSALCSCFIRGNVTIEANMFYIHDISNTSDSDLFIDSKLLLITHTVLHNNFTILAPNSITIMNKMNIYSDIYLYKVNIFISEYNRYSNIYSQLKTSCRCYDGSNTIISSGVGGGSINNYGTVRTPTWSSDTITINVGKNSNLDMRHFGRTYYVICPITVNMAKNSAAIIGRIKKNIKTIHIKEGFVGSIKNTTGTIKGDTQIVRRVHGE